MEVLLWSCPLTRSGDFGAAIYEPIWANYEPFSLCTTSENTGAIHQKASLFHYGLYRCCKKKFLSENQMATATVSPNCKLGIQRCRIIAVSTLCGAVQFWKMINDITPLGDSLTVQLKEIFHEAVELWSIGVELVLWCLALQKQLEFLIWERFGPACTSQASCGTFNACPRCIIMHGATFPAVHSENAGSCAQQAACRGLKWMNFPIFSWHLLKFWSFLADRFSSKCVIMRCQPFNQSLDQIDVCGYSFWLCTANRLSARFVGFRKHSIYCEPTPS